MKANDYKDLHSFLSGKARERGIKIEAFPELCGYSRSTIYRYMKGITPIHPEVEAQFIRTLSMDKREQEEFRRHIALSSQDNALLDTAEILDKFFLQPTNPSKSKRRDLSSTKTRGISAHCRS
ncbi:MAG: helix-turn-helix domain-containing protein [Oscillospiraceae bacterium]